MYRWLIFLCLALCAAPHASGKSQAVVAQSAPMRFSLWDFTGGNNCARFYFCTIRAEGQIDRTSAAALLMQLQAADLATPEAGQLTLHLDSTGGDVDGAIELGRLVRRLKMRVKLVRSKNNYELCRGSPDFVASIKLFPRWVEQSAETCVEVHASEFPSRCESACTLVFAAGIERELGVGTMISRPVGQKEYSMYRGIVSLNGVTVPPQHQLGFHPIRPNVEASGDKDMRAEELRYGAMWGQRELVKVSKYFDEIDMDRRAVEFNARPASDPSTSDLYYPTIAELEDVGLLIRRAWPPLAMKVQGAGSRVDGLAMVSGFRAALGIPHQFSLFCSTVNKRQNQMLLLLSIEGEISLAQIVSDDLIAPGIAAMDLTNDPLNAMMHGGFGERDGGGKSISWGIAVIIDDQPRYSREQILVFSDDRWHIDARTHPALFSMVNRDEVRGRISNFGMILEQDDLLAWQNARTIQIDFLGLAPPITIEVNDIMRQNFEMLKRNCIAPL